MDPDALNNSAASTARRNVCDNDRTDLSGDSSLFEHDKTVADKFDGVLYHALPTGQKVNIQFTIPVLFRDFLRLLEKEFVRSEWNVDDKFSVSSHIHGRKVTITVYEAEKTIEVSGPGHKIWKDIAFKRISTKLFTRFMQSFSADIQDSINTSKAQPDMTSTPVVSRPNAASVPVLPPDNSTRQERTPMESQMSAILESLAYHTKMISTLQEQLTNLTTQVVKLQEESNRKSATTQEKKPDTSSMLCIAVSPTHTNSSSNPSPNIIEDTYQTPSLPKSQPNPKRMRAKRINNNSPQQKNTQKSPQTNDSVRPLKTLIIGDSIIKGINQRGLKKHVHIHGISGATVETVLEQLPLFDLKNFSAVIISVGGNDISNGTNVEYVEEKYDQLILYIKNINQDCKVVICTACPRQDCNVSELNGILTSLSEEYNTNLVDMEKYFCDQNEIPTLRYYGKDKIHLSKPGIRRLLDAIEKSCDGLVLVENFELCAFISRPKGKPYLGLNSRRQAEQHKQWVPSGRNNKSNNKTQCCVKCGLTNHSTFNCLHKEQIKCHSCGFLGHKQYRCPSK